MRAQMSSLESIEKLLDLWCYSNHKREIILTVAGNKYAMRAVEEYAKARITSNAVELVRVLEHAMKKSDDEELRLIAKTYTASYPNAQAAIAHLFTQRLPPRQLIAALKAVVAPAPPPP